MKPKEYLAWTEFSLENSSFKKWQWGWEDELHTHQAVFIAVYFKLMVT